MIEENYQKKIREMVEGVSKIQQSKGIQKVVR